MHHIRTAGLLLAMLLLVRCGMPWVPAFVSEAPRASEATREAELLCVAFATPQRQVVEPARAPSQAETGVPHLAQVRELVRALGTPGCGCGNVIPEDGPYVPHGVKELQKFGEAASAAYEVILADPKSTWMEIAGTSTAIGFIPTDRRRFVPFAMQRLTTADALVPGSPKPTDGHEFARKTVRESAMYLLLEAGDERDAWVLVPFLYGTDRQLQRSAAEVLSKIGGPRELDAMSDWLAFQNRNDPRIATIRKLRNEFEARLRSRPSNRTF